MVKDTIDRRAARTRALLEDALMSLILKKGYEDIDVRDICDQARVGRSTFYNHYTGKDDLKRRGLDHLRRTMLDHQRDAHAEAGTFP